MENKIREIAIKNAAKYGKANVKSVLGAFLSEFPEYRSKVKDILPIVEKIVNDINNQKINIKIEENKKRKDKELELDNVKDKVVLRFAPNPSGPLHIGHARAAVLNDYFAKKYNGKFILRLEDTDPKRVLPEAYDMIVEDLEWLGVKIDEIVIQSDRLDIYYKYGEMLIKDGKAYVCECEAEKFRELRNRGIACSCRDREIEDNLYLWEKMLNGEIKAVVRLKTDLKHKNPSIRDFPIFRVEKEKHPRVDAYVYPLMNFSVPVDDHLLGITHVLRGKDHIVNTEKQRYIYKYFNWEEPEFIHYGILKIEDSVLSTSQIYEGIKKGIYEGWDDVRLGTLRALKRRGIRPEAIYKIMLNIGLKKADIKFSWENLYAINRELIDKEAKRYFFVWKPKLMKIEGAEKRIVRLRKHPDVKEFGYRELVFDGEVYVVSSEVEEGRMYRLMELFNVVVEKIEDNFIKARYHSDDFKVARKNRAKIIHWVPKDKVDVVILTPNGVIEGFAEYNVKEINVDEIIQFERFGFARLDKKEENKLIFCYAHR
ncbi:glutamyl-tRNA ligase [Methanocaldococcus villosus KIN24-T80]|uniref:Glutamate--tRNA ligase n=1 Tax=Methanocaldococcus villosus KIN24-T80 TaxID=1069083 RepID=N6VQC2_9EURY|nr:glutamate--tRNA ligase [Methanocaldococcus villosus]ENN96065.1 glutamyl-tRNA ligase [Methanocaldococcus villosus KIN24-T80]